MNVGLTSIESDSTERGTNCWFGSLTLETIQNNTNSSCLYHQPVLKTAVSLFHCHQRSRLLSPQKMTTMTYIYFLLSVLTVQKAEVMWHYTTWVLVREEEVGSQHGPCSKPTVCGRGFNRGNGALLWQGPDTMLESLQAQNVTAPQATHQVTTPLSNHNSALMLSSFIKLILFSAALLTTVRTGLYFYRMHFNYSWTWLLPFTSIETHCQWTLMELFMNSSQGSELKGETFAMSKQLHCKY